MNERTINNVIAIVVGVVAAISAHASGKPWWVDHPMFGDAFDVGTLTAVMTRGLMWMFGSA